MSESSLTSAEICPFKLDRASRDSLTFFSCDPFKMGDEFARRTGTLTCLAAGAQSYEWYENGVLMSGETSDSLALEWSEEKAGSTYTYSVKPVYTVFNERVVGDAVNTTVEYRSPQGLAISIK